MKVPEFSLKALYGDGADVILKGQNVIPCEAYCFRLSISISGIKNGIENLLIT